MKRYGDAWLVWSYVFSKLIKRSHFTKKMAPMRGLLSSALGGLQIAAVVHHFHHYIDHRVSALYAASLRHKIRAGVVRPIFTSMVDLSDNGGLMERFLSLPAPKMIMYGDQNASLSYLDHIETSGVRRCEIPQSSHFPMYSNPAVMWQEIAAFIGDV